MDESFTSLVLFSCISYEFKIKFDRKQSGGFVLFR